MTIFGRVVRWLRGRPVWAGIRYDPGDKGACFCHKFLSNKVDPEVLIFALFYSR